MTTLHESGPARRPQFVEATRASIVAVGALFAVGGWAGLFTLIVRSYPTVGNRWLFFALLHIALTGTALPLVQALNSRLVRPGAPPIPAMALVRQATWVGLFGAACAWLQIPRLLSWPMAGVLLLAFIVIETLLRLSESARYWQDLETRRGRE